MKKWIVPAGAVTFVLGAWYVSTLRTPNSPPESPPKKDLRAELEKVEREIDYAVRIP